MSTENTQTISPNTPITTHVHTNTDGLDESTETLSPVQKLILSVSLCMEHPQLLNDLIKEHTTSNTIKYSADLIGNLMSHCNTMPNQMQLSDTTVLLQALLATSSTSVSHNNMESLETAHRVLTDNSIPPVSNLKSKELPTEAVPNLSLVNYDASCDAKGRPYSYKCNHCPKVFTLNSRLVAHLRCHTGIRPYTCGECGFSFTQKSYLLRHAAVHKDDRPFTCDLCFKTYKHYGSLANHRKTHRSEKEDVKHLKHKESLQFCQSDPHSPEPGPVNLSVPKSSVNSTHLCISNNNMDSGLSTLSNCDINMSLTDDNPYELETIRTNSDIMALI